tara:strand:+ start:2508 stop:3518 length:1011 start_codon:yes stop_codon:yes gene_type:complete
MTNLIGLRGIYTSKKLGNVNYNILFSDSRTSIEENGKTIPREEDKLKIHQAGNTQIAASGFVFMTGEAIRIAQDTQSGRSVFSPIENIMTTLYTETQRISDENPKFPFPSYLVSGLDKTGQLQLYALNKNGPKQRLNVSRGSGKAHILKCVQEESKTKSHGFLTNPDIAFTYALEGSEYARKNDEAVNGRYQIGLVAQDGTKYTKSMLLPPETDLGDFSESNYLATMAGFDINKLSSWPGSFIESEMEKMKGILPNFHHVFMEFLKDYSAKRTSSLSDEAKESKARVLDGIDALILRGRDNLLNFLEEHAHAFPENVVVFPRIEKEPNLDDLAKST